MNPLHVLGVVAGCLLIFSAVVTFLTLQGVPLVFAFLGVYLAVIGTMLGMQRRAREICESLERQRRETSARSGVSFLQTQLPMTSTMSISVPGSLPVHLQRVQAANSAEGAASDESLDVHPAEEEPVSSHPVVAKFHRA